MAMNRRVFLLASAGSLLLGSAAFAATSPEDQVARAIKGDGFRITSQRRTLLGRVRFLAVRGDTQREVVMDPSSGEILRDYSRVADNGRDGGSPTADSSGTSGGTGSGSSGGGSASGGGEPSGGGGSSGGGEPSGGGTSGGGTTGGGEPSGGGGTSGGGEPTGGGTGGSGEPSGGGSASGGGATSGGGEPTKEPVREKTREKKSSTGVLK